VRGGDGPRPIWRRQLMTSRGSIDLVAVTFACLIGIAVVSFASPLPVRLPVGVVASLVLPGYALSAALFLPGELDRLERAALAFSLSLGLTIVAAPVLDRLPGGLRPEALVAAVSSITLSSVAVAWWRRRSSRLSPRRRVASGRPRGGLRSKPAAWAGIAVGVVAIASVALLARDVGSGAQAATEFFLLGPDGTVDHVPAHVLVGKPTTITVGISNHDDSTQAYQVIVESGSERLATAGPITVASGQTWTGDLGFTVPAPGVDQMVRISLLRRPDAQPFRSLSLQIDASAAS